jgi:hypothetical protein
VVVGKPVAVRSESSQDRDEAKRSAATAIAKVIHRKRCAVVSLVVPLLRPRWFSVMGLSEAEPTLASGEDINRRYVVFTIMLKFQQPYENGS